MIQTECCIRNFAERRWSSWWTTVMDSSLRSEGLSFLKRRRSESVGGYAAHALSYYHLLVAMIPTERRNLWQSHFLFVWTLSLWILRSEKPGKANPIQDLLKYCQLFHDETQVRFGDPSLPSPREGRGLYAWILGRYRRVGSAKIKSSSIKMTVGCWQLANS